MKRILALSLSLLLLFPFASCARNTTDDTVTADVSTLETQDSQTLEETQTLPDTFDYPEIHDKVTWEKINSFPIANSTMSIDELRSLCVDFFRFAKTFTWTPNADYHFEKNAKGDKDSVLQGEIIGGLPYVGLGSGSVYRTMDYIDEATGILDIKKAGEDRYLFGNQCSIGAYWGWGRVINSADYDWTYNMVQRRGFLKIGPYTYDESIYSFSSDLNTVKICKDNGEQTMFESYACLQPADGLVQYNTAGHVIMCSAIPVIVRNTDGTIDGKESYILKIDQGQTWKEYPQSNGDPRSVKGAVDGKVTFSKLFSDKYIPFTYAEFLGTDPVEDAQCEFMYSGSNITVTKLKQVIITSNYGISDIYVYVKSLEGEVLYSTAYRATTAGLMRTVLGDSIISKEISPYAAGYNLEVVCQLSNGERPTIYTGKLQN